MNESLLLALPPVDLYWAIEPRWAAQAQEQLAGIDWAEHVREYRAQQAQEEAESAVRGGDDDRPSKPYEMMGATAVLQMSGPVTKRPQSFGNGFSTVKMRRLVRQAAADPDVQSVLLVIDSPGGQVSGTFDLVEDIARARQQKRVVAYVEDLGASAAYAIASQADAIYANPSALVGSIGTYMVVQDLSRLAENAGVKVHVIRAGEFKGAGVPGAPLTDRHLAEFQRQVDDLNEQFVKAVSRGRALPVARVRELADGRIHIAKQAQTLGLIDGVRSLDAVLSDLQQGRIGARVQPAALGGNEEGRSMNRMQSFLAWLNGEGEEPQAGGTPPAAPSAPATSHRESELQAQLNQEREQRQRLENQMRQDREERIRGEAETWAAAQVQDRRALPAEQATLQALYAQAAQDDAANPLPQAQDGSRPTRVGQLKAAVAARPQHHLTQELVAAGGAFVLQSGAGAGDEADKIREQARKDGEALNGAGKGR